MKTPIFVAFVLVSFVVTEPAIADDVYVPGYYNSNGTWVHGHWKSRPNKTIEDNYSSAPNFNPYTGVPGTQKPDFGRDDRDPFAPRKPKNDGLGPVYNPYAPIKKCPESSSSGGFGTLPPIGPPNPLDPYKKRC